MASPGIYAYTYPLLEYFYNSIILKVEIYESEMNKAEETITALESEIDSLLLQNNALTLENDDLKTTAKLEFPQ